MSDVIPINFLSLIEGSLEDQKSKIEAAVIDLVKHAENTENINTVAVVVTYADGESVAHYSGASLLLAGALSHLLHRVNQDLDHE